MVSGSRVCDWSGMWLSVYFLASIYLDALFTVCMLFSPELSQWLHFLKITVKVLVLVMLAERLSNGSAGVWVTVIVVLVSALLALLIFFLASALLFLNQDSAGITAFIVNRIVETPIMVLYCSKPSARGSIHRVSYVARTRDQVVPAEPADMRAHVSRGASAHVSKTCTWVELGSPGEHSDDSESALTCCICLERIELNDVVTQFACKHCFHTDCVFEWVIRRERFGRGQNNLCPMRCALKRTAEASVV
eukprot:TRINITY_DN9170_c0_g2_i1.p1 TRINITY_DN9170_c0_g2~~TRINITY_DN9170_c0_g2_i1.p1  ORF type:complete len:249 (+),score=17.35 TRINITY_DN9170_c0_g2_i1:78-824(+)